MKVYKLEFHDVPEGDKCRDNLGNENYYCCDHFECSSYTGDSCTLFGKRITDELKVKECIKNTI